MRTLLPLFLLLLLLLLLFLLILMWLLPSPPPGCVDFRSQHCGIASDVFGLCFVGGAAG